MQMRLRELRKAKGENLTLEDVAEDLGMTTATLSRLENDKQNVKLDTLERLAVYYGVSVPELFVYDGDNPLLRLAWSIPPDQIELAADLLQAISRRSPRDPAGT